MSFGLRFNQVMDTGATKSTVNRNPKRIQKVGLGGCQKGKLYTCKQKCTQWQYYLFRVVAAMAIAYRLLSFNP